MIYRGYASSCSTLVQLSSNSYFVLGYLTPMRLMKRNSTALGDSAFLGVLISVQTFNNAKKHEGSFTSSPGLSPQFPVALLTIET